MKVNGQYYRDVLLFHQMLPAIKHVAGDIRLSFNKTTLHLIVSSTPLNCYSKKHRTSLVLTSGHQTARSQSNGLQVLGCYVAECMNVV